MTRITRTALLAGILASTMLAYGSTAVIAADPPPSVGDQENVLITFRIVALEGGKRVPLKTYTLVVASGSQGSELLAGARVPFPTGPAKTSDDPDDDVAPSGFVYQNVGFVTRVEAWILDETKIRLMANIEDSRVERSETGLPPTVQTRQMRVNAVLTDGVPLELTRGEGVMDRPGFVEIEAKILR